MIGSTVTIREVNQKTSAVIQRVRDGEELVVTVSGTPAARIIPYRPRNILEQMIADGRARPATRTDFPALDLHVSESAIERVLEEERDEGNPLGDWEQGAEAAARDRL